jgi:hypothetical protein
LLVKQHSVKSSDHSLVSGVEGKYEFSFIAKLVEGMKDRQHLRELQKLSVEVQRTWKDPFKHEPILN